MIQGMKTTYCSLVLVAAFILVLLATPVVAGEVKADFLYRLADFTGVVPYSWVRPVIDRQTHEVYVANFSERAIRIFNDNGMAIYEFGDDLKLGSLYDLAIEDAGNILLLSYKTSTSSAYTITRCNYRGEVLSTLEVKNLPDAFAAGFAPTVILYRNGQIYLADKEGMKVAVIDANGAFVESYDIAEILKIDEKKKQDTVMVGFSVDREGNMLLTVPVNFQASIISPDRKVRSFGTRGSSPGRFNIIGGIIADDFGNIYIADTLRCVVMIFDKDFEFKKEFGYRGDAPENLIAPLEMAIDGEKLYTTQSRNRGVSVFRISLS